METDNKKPPLSGRTQKAKIKSLTKNNTIMRTLRNTPLHRFKAKNLGDYCLPITIPTLTKRHGLAFLRTMVKAPNRFGVETSVMQFSTSDEDKLKIVKILGVTQ